MDPDKTALELRGKQVDLELAIENNAVLNIKDLAADLADLYGYVADHVEATGWTILVDVEPDGGGMSDGVTST